MTDSPDTHPLPSAPVPAVAPAVAAALDRVMAERFGVDTLQLMELAGRAVADEARRRLPGADARRGRVLVLAGSGGNGGDGLVAARLLHAWGARVDVVLSHPPERLRGPAARHHAALLALGLVPSPPPPPGATPDLPPADLLVDALLGSGLAGAPGRASAALVRAANAHPAPVLAVDLPSGLDAASGNPFDPCVRAAATLTLALPKVGLLAPAARPFVGELLLADIGVPPAAWAAVGLDPAPPPLFARAAVLRLAADGWRPAEALPAAP